MIRRTLAIAGKEILHLRRDWRTVLSLLGMPMLLLLIYGFAISFDVKDVRLAIVDQDGSPAARELRQAFVTSGYFDLVAHGHDPRVLDGLFDRDRVQAALVIPERYGARLAAGRTVPLQFVLDGSDSQTASTVLSYARQIVGSVTPVVRGAGGTGSIEPRPLVWYNPNLESALFLVPGLVAFILMVSSVVATALAVVREKERGTMDSLRATPVLALELLLGKTLPYLAISSLAAGGSLLLAWLLFDVPIRGSILGLALVTILYLVGGLSLGILISTLAETQQVAFQMALLSSMLPTLLLSGFIFPISSMPVVLQWFTSIIPARYFLNALRGIVLKGAGIEIWWGQAAALVVYAIVTMAIATRRTVRSL